MVDKVEVSAVQWWCLFHRYNIVVGGDTVTASQEKEETWEDPGTQRRLQILSEVSSLLNEDSDGSSTLPWSPRPEDQL